MPRKSKTLTRPNLVSKTCDVFAKCCRQCSESRSGKRPEQKSNEQTLHGADKENGESEEEQEATDQQLRKELDDLNVKNFLQIISRIDEDAHSFAEFVDISELNPPDPGNSREKPDLKKHTVSHVSRRH